MNDDDATALLDRLAGGLQDPAPPTGLLVGGRRLAARRRRLRAGASLAALVVAVGSIAVVPRLLGPDAAAPGPAQQSENPLPTPPAGTRWVGHGRAVVAVPEEWTTNDVTCPNSPLSDTVFVDLGPVEKMLDCIGPAPRPPVSYVELYLSEPSDGEPFATHADCTVVPQCSPSLTVPEAGVRFLVVTRGEGAAAQSRAILDSLTILPDGWTTVPWREVPSSIDQMLHRIEDAGLVADYTGAETRPADVVLDPLPGSPVREGGTVTVADRPAAEMTPTMIIASPGDVVELTFPTEFPRGVGFTLAADNGTTYYLTSATGDRGSPRWSAAPVGWIRIGIGGPGPDRVVIPDVAPDDTYQLCTANAAGQVCTRVFVRD